VTGRIVVTPVGLDFADDHLGRAAADLGPQATTEKAPGCGDHRTFEQSLESHVR
jgi:hypothetical protein